ncbi:hypothetical protein ABIB62_004693 [Mucilaginibacter sp. UYP25]|uniref:hypothetical protein n=1 Tax=unclassified Mucilaginibacter TaxID=2617802 RepID=UPI0033927D04
MPLFKISFTLMLFANLQGFARPHQQQKNNNINYQPIENTIARAAIKALQESDVSKWKSLFIVGAKLYDDDGSPRDFQDFSTKAIGHEYFLSLDKIENQGTTVYGHFHTEKYGDFRARFNFHINTAGKISRLDISQVKY